MKSIHKLQNQSIVRMPGRNYPGVVIQGDTLFYLSALAESIYKRVQLLDDEQLKESSEELKDLLSETLLHYKAVMAEHNIE